MAPSSGTRLIPRLLLAWFIIPWISTAHGKSFRDSDLNSILEVEIEQDGRLRRAPSSAISEGPLPRAEHEQVTEQGQEAVVRKAKSENDF